MEQRKKNRNIDIGDRRKGVDRRVLADRRRPVDRRSGWGNIEESLLRGTLAATASIVFQLSRPFTIILGYVDLLIKNTREEETKQKLNVIKEQLQLVSQILNDFREVKEFKKINFDGVDILVTDKLMEEEERDKLDQKYYDSK